MVGFLAAARVIPAARVYLGRLLAQGGKQQVIAIIWICGLPAPCKLDLVEKVLPLIGFGFVAEVGVVHRDPIAARMVIRMLEQFNDEFFKFSRRAMFAVAFVAMAARARSRRPSVAVKPNATLDPVGRVER